MAKLDETLETAKDQGMEPMDNMSLKGGLQGRFSSSFCILQTSVDALSRFTEDNTNPTQAEKNAPLFAEIGRQISYLERLSAYAAELAISYTAAEAVPLCDVNLVQTLTALCACAQEELQLRHIKTNIRLDDAGLPTALRWIQGDTGLVDGIFVNLISNSLQAGASAITISTGEDGSLRYQDDGTGAEVGLLQALLVDGHPTGANLAKGSLGLLVAHRHAAAMGWKIEVEPCTKGVCIRFYDIQPATQADTAVLQSGNLEQRRSTELMQQRIRREFVANFGLVDKS